jgi:hypothetical protein
VELENKKFKKALKVIKGIASRNLCNGAAGLLGVSPFTGIQHFVFALKPPNLTRLGSSAQSEV